MDGLIGEKFLPLCDLDSADMLRRPHQACLSIMQRAAILSQGSERLVLLKVFREKVCRIKDTGSRKSIRAKSNVVKVFNFTDSTVLSFMAWYALAWCLLMLLVSGYDSKNLQLQLLDRLSSVY